MSKHDAVFDKRNFRYIISPLNPGNTITLQEVFKAIKNSTVLKWNEIAEFAGLSNANRAFRVAYLRKDTADMLMLKEFLTIDSGSNCAYFYDKDHKPEQVPNPHVGPVLINEEGANQTVTAGVPTRFATRVTVDDPLKRRLTVTIKPTNGHIVTPEDNTILASNTSRIFNGSLRTINNALHNAMFIGATAGSATVNITVDDGAGQSNSTVSATINLTVNPADEISIPSLSVPESVEADTTQYVPVTSIVVTDTDNKILAVRVTAFNCQVAGFGSLAGYLENGQAYKTFGIPAYINKDLEKVMVRRYNNEEPASIGVEVKSSNAYDLKYIAVNKAAADVDEDEEGRDEAEAEETKTQQPVTVAASAQKAQQPAQVQTQAAQTTKAATKKQKTVTATKQQQQTATAETTTSTNTSTTQDTKTAQAEADK